MFVLGLCGRSGSGKSTVASVFGRRGINGVDCDALTYEIYKAGSECLKALAESFGQEVLNADGSLDRQSLAKKAFADAESTARLNSVTHGFILKALEEKLEAIEKTGAKLAFVDAPLLFEAGLEKRVDAVICVLSPDGENVRRVALRDGRSEAETRARLEKQRSAEFLRANSHLCIYNGASLQALERKATKALLWALLRFRVPMGKLSYKESL